MSNQVEVKVIPGGVSLLSDGEEVFVTAGYQPSEFLVSFRGNGSYEARLSRLLRGLAAPNPVVFVSPLTPQPEEQIDCTQHGKFTVEVKPAPGHDPKEVTEAIHAEMERMRAGKPPRDFE